jgi:hypothetical protein
MRVRWSITVLVGVALASAVAATLLGGLVSNPTGFEGLRDSNSVFIDARSYGWPVPWVADSNAAREGDIGLTASIASFALSMALWFWPVLVALVLLRAAMYKNWTNGLGAVATACVVAFGIASLITLLGALNTSDGVWYSGRRLDITYESAGWPFEWSTHPALPLSPGVYEDEQRAYHELMRPYKMLGYSPVWLTINWLSVATPVFLTLLLSRGSLRAIAGWNRHGSGMRARAARG